MKAGCRVLSSQWAWTRRWDRYEDKADEGEITE
jgi:hypothetical protein